MMATECRAKNPAMCRMHGSGNDYGQLQEEANRHAVTGDINAYIATREKMDNELQKETPSRPLSTSQIPTEATSINLLYSNPVYDEIYGYTKSVECVCGKVRYGADYKCRCGADPKDIKGYRVAEQDRKLVESRVAVKAQHWYHATAHDNWDDVVKSGDFPIHLGNEQAAFERTIEQVGSTGNSDYYLYKVTINPFARVAKNICPDLNNSWSTTMDEFKDNTRGRDFVRYVNSYEDGGSVSLFGEP